MFGLRMEEEELRQGGIRLQPLTTAAAAAAHHSVLEGEGEGVSLPSFILEIYDIEAFHFPASFFEEQASSSVVGPEEDQGKQQNEHKLQNLSGGVYMVFTGFLAILCGLLSFNLESRNTTVTRILIKSCNYAILAGSICIIVSVVLLLFTTSSRLSSLLNIPKILFLIALGLLSICMFICFLLVQLSY